MPGIGLTDLENVIPNYILGKESKIDIETDRQVHELMCTHTHKSESDEKTNPFFNNNNYVYFGKVIGLLNRGLQQDNDFTKRD